MTALDRARAAFGDDDGAKLPAWIDTLARACDASSQAQVAKRVGYSPATISYVLKNRYAGDLAKVERAVRFALQPKPVDCPVLGDIAPERCLKEQREPYAAHNPQRVALYRACRACPNRQGGKPRA